MTFRYLPRHTPSSFTTLHKYILQEKLLDLGVQRPGVPLARSLRKWFLASTNMTSAEQSLEDIYRLIITYTMLVSGWNPEPPEFSACKKYKGPEAVPIPLLIMIIWQHTCHLGEEPLPDELEGHEFLPLSLLPYPLFPG